MSAAGREETVADGSVDSDVSTPVTRLERTFQTGVVFPVIHTRRAHVAYAAFFRSDDEYTAARGRVLVDRAGPRLAYTFRSAHEYGNSISPEQGIAVAVTSELVRQAMGASADATSSSADLRAYVPGLVSHHVIAVRWVGGVTTGSLSVGRVFTLGGSETNSTLLSFDADNVSLMRGFSANTFAGMRLSLFNLEYRLPLWRIERGVSVWPAFLHTLHAAVFADVGRVWTDGGASDRIKTSFGAELAMKAVIGFWAPLEIAGGIARGHDADGRVADRTRVYARVGYSF